MIQSFSLPDYFTARESARRAFADQHGYKGRDIVPLYEDMASRRFYRVGGAVLMDSLPDDHPHATIGHRLYDFIRIADALRARGVHAPEIYAADAADGFLLMEDLGDRPVDEAVLGKAVDVLIKMRGGFRANELGLPDYFSSHIHARHDRVVHWYAPCVRGAKNPDGWGEDYKSIWRDIERGLPAPPMGFVHADYARHNLRLIDNECGVLDFQGAQWGPVAYDLVNLLEDGRMETPPGLKQSLYDQYTADFTVRERAAFGQWYGVLAAQFHLRLIGQFIKLALQGGKPRYLDYIPLLQSYLRAELDKPLLVPLKTWFEDRSIRFDGAISVSGDYIRSDAA